MSHHHEIWESRLKKEKIESRKSFWLIIIIHIRISEIGIVEKVIFYRRIVVVTTW